MKSIRLAAIFLLLAIPLLSQAQRCLLKAASPQLPAARHIISAQLLRAGEGRLKPAGFLPVRLIADNYSESGNLNDSLHYYYSGAHYSLLDNQNVYSYFDQFYPTASYAQQQNGSNNITLQFDSVKAYDSPTELYEKQERQYNSYNLPSFWSQLDVNSGMVTGYKDANLYYNVDATLHRVRVMEDTQAIILPGILLTQPVDYMGVGYTGTYRTEDLDTFLLFDAIERTTYSYDAGGKLLSRLFEYSNSGAPFEASNQDSFYYDASGRLAAQNTKTWDGALWQPDYLDSFTYSSGFAQYTNEKYFVYDADSMRLIAGSGSRFVLMADGSVDSIINLSYNNDVPSQNEAIKLIYGTNTYLDQAIGYNPAGTVISTEHFYYEDQTPGAVATINNLNATLYPNPARREVSIFLKESAGAAFSIINTLGEVVQTGTLRNGSNAVPLSLSPGLYYVCLNGAKGEKEVQRLRVQ